jgi:hypothetical protein
MKNLFEILALNRHGDYQEVNFTSVLSYLLNPKEKHGLEYKILSKIFSALDLNVTELSDVEVSSEKRLGEEGSIDIYIKSKEYIVGIEAKIWDESAKKDSNKRESQLVRYCRGLCEDAKKENKAWYLIFLIPNEESHICLREYESVKADNVKLMVWNFTGTELPEGCISLSILDIIEKIQKEENDLVVEVKWILESLFNFIPKFNEEPKDDQRFPTKLDLMKLNTWEIFSPFFEEGKKGPNSINTTVGIPYGVEKNRGQLHGNSLYRIRTTKSYYVDLTEKEKNFPNDFIEIELWPDVYGQVKGKIQEWLDKNKIDETIKDDKHLDGGASTTVKILTIDKPLSNESIKEFNCILRKGYRELEEPPNAN